MYQATITKILIICSEPSHQLSVDHSPDPSLSGGLDSLLGFLRGNPPLLVQAYQVYGWFSDCTYQCYADLYKSF